MGHQTRLKEPWFQLFSQFPAGPIAVATTESSMAKPNYSFEKRQREAEKKRKKQEKESRKSALRQVPGTAPAQPPDDGGQR